MIRDAQQHNENATPKDFEIDVLMEALPHYFDGDGNFKLEKFQNMLQEEQVELSRESYELNFLGKSYARLLASLETETVIVPNEEHNADERNADSENIYITGDNLDALKHLAKSYRKKIKVIYIDPPYNTGGDGFIYNDDYSFTVEELVDQIGVTEQEAERIIDLHGKSSHSAWLTFMLPRLVLAKSLLAPDGVIFISIDDNEQANLKLLCDEIFGEENALSRITWESKSKSQNTKEARTRLQPRVESILVYKNFNQVAHFALDVKEAKNYPLEDEKGRYRNYPIGEMSNSGIRSRDSMVFPILGVSPGKGMQWKIGAKTVNEFEERGDLELIDGVPHFRMRPADEDENTYIPFWSHFFDKESHGTAESANREIEALFGRNNLFDTVKPTALIKKLVRHMRGLDKDSDFVVLDFFSGSATTGDAVMQLNAEENTAIKYILVQIAESTENNRVATELGFKTIDEIGRKRIELAADKIKLDTGADIDYGFKHYTLETPPQSVIDSLEDFAPDDNLFSDDPLESLDFDGTTADNVLLTTWIVQDGYGLNPEIEKVTLQNYELIIVGNTAYAIDGGMSSDDIRVLTQKLEDGEIDITNLVYFHTAIGFERLRELDSALRHLRNRSSVTITARW